MSQPLPPPPSSTSSRSTISSSSNSLTSATGLEIEKSGGGSPSPVEGIPGPSNQIIDCVLPKVELEFDDNYNKSSEEDVSSEEESGVSFFFLYYSIRIKLKNNLQIQIFFDNLHAD